MRKTQIKIQNEEHQIYTVKLNKIPLSLFDDNHYLLAGGIASYAYNHKDVFQDEDAGAKSTSTFPITW